MISTPIFSGSCLRALERGGCRWKTDWRTPFYFFSLLSSAGPWMRRRKSFYLLQNNPSSNTPQRHLRRSLVGPPGTTGLPRLHDNIARPCEGRPPRRLHFPGPDVGLFQRAIAFSKNGHDHYALPAVSQHSDCCKWHSHLLVVHDRNLKQ